MGYTHYLSGVVNAEQFPFFSKCVRHALKKFGEKGVKFAGWDGNGEPEITDEIISFNGAGENSFETCRISATDGSDFHFCKTQYRPYDETVECVFALAHFLLGVDFDSDGGEEAVTRGKAHAEMIIQEVKNGA